MNIYCEIMVIKIYIIMYIIHVYVPICQFFFSDLSLSDYVSQVFPPSCPVACPDKNLNILMTTALLSFQNLVSYWDPQRYI